MAIRIHTLHTHTAAADHAMIQKHASRFSFCYRIICIRWTNRFGSVLLLFCALLCIIIFAINRIHIILYYTRGNSLWTKCLWHTKCWRKNERNKWIHYSLPHFYILYQMFNWWMLHKTCFVYCSLLWYHAMLNPHPHTQQPLRQFVHTYACSISILGIIYVWYVSFIEFMLMKFCLEHLPVICCFHIKISLEYKLTSQQRSNIFFFGVLVQCKII